MHITPYLGSGDPGYYVHKHIEIRRNDRPVQATFDKIAFMLLLMDFLHVCRTSQVPKAKKLKSIWL